MGALLAGSYRRGREDALGHIRELYRAILFIGRHMKQAPAPADLKQKMGLW